MAREITDLSELSNTLARQLRAARDMRGLSQRQLAKVIGCSSAVISRYEGEKRSKAISLPLVIAAARALRVNLAWLMLGEGPRDIDAPVIVLQLDATAPDRLRELADQLESGLVP